MNDVYAQWEELCSEFEAAREAHLKALGVVTGAFRAVAAGGSNNPSDQELSDMTDTWARVQAIERRMDEFVKKNS